MAKYIWEHKREAERISTLINPNSDYIMDCTNSKLKEIILQQLNIIDDLQQECADKNMQNEYESTLIKYYSVLEVYSKNITAATPVYVEFRNEIRLICKNVLKIAGNLSIKH